MSYVEKTVMAARYGIVCDGCGRRFSGDGEWEDSRYAADFLSSTDGWRRSSGSDGRAIHICPECIGASGGDATVGGGGVAMREADRVYQKPTMCSGPYDREPRVRAYVRGRTAGPCDEQVEAVAVRLAEILDGRSCRWGDIPAEDRHRYEWMAGDVLAVARKAVM